MQPYGMGSVRSENGSNAWERSVQYGYRPPAGHLWNRSAALADAADSGAVLGYAPRYDYPIYSTGQESTGYRFRPLNTASDATKGRRYTGNYPAPRYPSRGISAPRWNESPAYGRPQPQHRGIPAFENRSPYFQLPSGHLYSAR